MNKKITAAIVVVVAAVVLAAVALSGLNLNLSSQAISGKNIVQTAQENTNLTKFNGALNTAGLTDVLNGTGPYTVFAPTDAAFNALNQTQLNMTKNNATLVKVLKYHVVPGKILVSQLTNNLTMKSLDGYNLVVIKNKTGTFVNNAKVDANGTEVSNGMLYTINKVLFPQTIVETLANTSQLSKLADVLKKANITNGLNGTGPFTVFAPSDSAFSAMDQTELNRLTGTNDTTNLTKLIAYHLLPYSMVVGNGTNSTLLKTIEGNYLVMTVNASGVFINNAKVTTTNIVCTNGVVFIIDKVLTTPKTVLQTAQDSGSFTKLMSAINAANLTSTLNGTGPFTVFAPNDAAFGKLDQAILNKLISSDRANLTKLLTYHVVSGMVPSFQLKNGTVTTLEGEKLNVTVNGTTIKVGNVTVITANIICSNGIIHVIDQVLVPPSMDLKAIGSSSSGGTTPPTGGGTCGD